MSETRTPANDDAAPGYEELLHQQEDAELHEPPGDWRIEDWIVFAIFWALAGVVFLQFFTRYVLNDSIAWTEEIARYLLICVTFVGAAMAARKGTHIALELALFVLPPVLRRWLRLLLAAITVAFFAVAAWLCFEIADAMWYQPMVVVDLPLGLVYYVAFFGLALTTIRFAWHAVVRFRAGEEPRESGAARP
ncbi:TRAP transporter small permease [Elioraea sp. Yellowstone]|uniref:TRAP transporter small permease n=1 Tax=Elioraea sp. Yellowstone TaxID=2592070 RepID=UPI001386E8D2|nr:TRAP transporter small permease [Elioraea sp. Yellowstone]